MNKSRDAVLALKTVQLGVLKTLGEKEYKKKVSPYQNMLSLVMKSNQINEFEALQKVKKESSLYNNKDMSKLLFISAAIEISERSI